MSYDITTIPLSPEINWTPCYDKFLCMQLQVPWDYQDPSVGTTNVAFIKRPGANGGKQDILYNPGGPGGSGVNALLGDAADDMLAIFGQDYNIVSFDPRGVNNSGPFLKCFEDEDERTKFTASQNASLEETFEQSKATGEQCTKNNENTNAKYVGTSAVAQDMMWFSQQQAIVNGEDPGEVKVWYYGVSYGTIIGQTFAAMYPQHVGRMLIDGNVYGVEHYNGLVPSDVDDADKSWAFFFKYCHEAGPDNCAFAGNSTSVTEMELRFRVMLASLDADPIVIEGTPITGASFLSSVYSQTYGPIGSFSSIAKSAAALEARDIEAITEIAAQTAAKRSVTSKNPDYQGVAESDALTIITCVDVNTRYNLNTFEEWQKLTATLQRMSYYQGLAAAKSNILMCRGMDIQPPASQYFAGFNESYPTNTPILFINTLGDPITPLSSALRMSDRFEKSVVLSQDTPGHGFMSWQSECSNGHIARYFLDGTLPPSGTVCESKINPFTATASEKKRDLKRRELMGSSK
ncbi:alpha/beta-hydrolase [Amniculicola lignicola CBS 123094]|uniref:Alpha/beta-hydrolase n=1 Tax=Amniculicola lignicola CBS 123094 TaxID=1392246 RepID=A0A6A5WPZ7_9PLEO|nr:alpha/beta-hydrolase [Amniculicola lignicola CBS 123094]